MLCPHCQGDLVYKGHDSRSLLGLGGTVCHRRARYRCKECGKGYFPEDEQLGLGSQRLTPATEQIVALAGVVGSFADGAERLLELMAGVRVSESTVQRVTEAAGERLAAAQEQGACFGQECQWDWPEDRHGQKIGYLGIDGIFVPQQGPGGSQAESRQVYVARVWNPPEAQEQQPSEGERRFPREAEKPKARFVAGSRDQQQTLRLLCRHADQVGGQQVDQWIALSDAGAGFEERLRLLYPGVVCIVDFWHALEHLRELAAWKYPEEQPRQRELGRWKQLLLDSGGAAVLEELEALALSGPHSEVLDETLSYYRNHHHKMDYPRYLEAGWQIGSGAVESGCKKVVAERLKGSGRRWGLAGTCSVSQLRGLFCSEPSCWHDFWSAA